MLGMMSPSNGMCIIIQSIKFDDVIKQRIGLFKTSFVFILQLNLSSPPTHYISHLYLHQSISSKHTHPRH